MAHPRLNLARSLFLLGLACCTPAPPPGPPPTPPPPPSAAPLVPFGAAPWGRFTSERFELALPLPDGRAWRIDDHKSPWLTATHAASASTLVVRSWVEDGRVDRHRCEERARLWHTFPDTSRAEAVQERSIDKPAGFDTFVSVGVVQGREEDPATVSVTGFALAFGGHVHRCFVWAFTTAARGPGGAALVGERLATMVDGSLGGLVVESKLTPRIREEPVFR